MKLDNLFKISSFCFLLLFLPLSLCAKEVTVGNVRDVAQSLINARLLGFSIDTIECLKNSEGQVIGYATILKPEGFIIVSNNKNIAPVISFSGKGQLDLNSSGNSFLTLVISDLESRYKALEKSDLILYNPNPDRWEKFLIGSNVTKSEKGIQEVYGPLLTTTWSNSGHYDDKTPRFYGTLRCAVGCTAVSAAQILNFWKRPSFISFFPGEENDSYVSYGPIGYTVSIPEDYSNYSFPSFDELNNNLSHIEYSGDDEEEAYLCFGIGIKSKMTYGLESGARIDDAIYKKIGYGSATERSKWNDDIFQKVIDNIKDGWPVHIGLSENDEKPGGHSAVIDGYDSEINMFHINMGWGGFQDGWYELGSIGYLPTYHIIDKVIYDICPLAGWSQWGADACNSKRTYYTFPSQPIVKWNVTSRGANHSCKGLIVSRSGRVYVSCSPGGVDPDYHPSIMVIRPDGTRAGEVFIAEENESVSSPVQNSKGSIFVSTGTGRIYKYEERSGFELIFQDSNQDQFDYELKIDEGDLIYANTDNNLYCINSITGTRQWTVSAPPNCYFFRGAPAIDVVREKVYISYYNSFNKTSSLITINRLNGSILNVKLFQEIPTSSRMVGIASIASNGKVYFGCKTKLYELNPDNNYSLRELYDNNFGRISDAPAIGKNGVIYFYCWKNDNEVVVNALNPIDGKVNWEIPFSLAAAGYYGTITNIYIDNHNNICITLHFDDGEDDYYTLYTYKDNGTSASFMWKRDIGSWGGFVAFGPDNTLYYSNADQVTALAELDEGESFPVYTDNNAPYIPYYSYPQNGSVNVDTAFTFTWSSSDPDGHNLKYKLYLGLSGMLSVYESDIESNSFNISGLMPDSTYHWSIAATDGQSVTYGPIWNFKTSGNPPSQPGPISGSTSACQGSSQTYNISEVAGATSFTWTLPSGWPGSSTTSSITTTVGANSGTLTVTANNSSGSSLPQTLSVTVITTPTQPGSITGETDVTAGQSYTYSIGAVSGATSYTWTLPSGWSGSSTSTSITATAGSAGTILVTANNACGSSEPRTLNVTTSSVIITAPNGGETWQVSSTQNITWTSNGTSGNVRIEYSTNNGSSWINITANTPDNGTYTWTVPNMPSMNCLVRISDTDGSPTDQSNAVFTILAVSAITVTAPNGGENWQVGSTQNITWTSNETSGNVWIEYSIDNGANFVFIVTSTPDDGSFTWAIPNTPSSSCLIRIRDAVGGYPFDISNSVFTISAVSVTDVSVQPTTMNLYAGGSTGTVVATILPTNATNQIVNWTSSSTAVATVSSTGVITPLGEGTANITATTADGGYTATCEVTVSVPSIIVTSPNGSETWQVGSNQNITWTSNGTSGNVRIEYSTNNGSIWIEIITSTPDDGSYIWTVPNSPSASSLIRISDTDGSPTDQSNNIFTISNINNPPNVPRLLTPGNNSSWTTPFDISWECTDPDQGDVLSYTLRVRLKGTSSWDILSMGSQTSYPVSGWSDTEIGTYEWSVVASDGESQSISDTWEFTLIRLTLSATPTNVPVASTSSSTGSINVVSNTSWSVIDDVAWLNLSPASGTGNGTVTVTTSSANTSTTPRSANVTFSASGVNSVTVVVTQAGAGPTLSATPANVPVASTSSSTGSINVVSNTSWSVIDDAAWLNLSPASGTGNGTVTVTTASANTSTTPRSANVTFTASGVNSVTVVVTQAGTSNSPPDKPTLLMPLDNSSNTLPTRFSWTCSDPDGDELTYLLRTRMIGEATWIENFLNNQNFLDVADIDHDLYNIPMEWCVVASDGKTESTSDIWEYTIITIQLIVSPDNQDVGVEAGNTTFNILSNASWIISDHSEWLAVNPSMSYGNGTITVTYSENNSTNNRIGSITVSEQGYNPRMETVTVTQEAIRLLVSPTNQNVFTASGMTTFIISSNIDWIAISNQSWCTVTPSGTGNGTITATYQANSDSSSRTATITISGSGVDNQTVTVTQTGTTPTLTVTPLNQNVTSPSGTISFDVSSNISWAATSIQDWCTVTSSGIGNGTITTTYQANTGSSSRTASITVSGSGVNNQTVTVTQSGTTPTLIVNSPNGGETWLVSNTQNITWTSNGTSGNVRIEYSTNNGSSWTDISASTRDDGSHPWTIPNTPSTHCLVRISDTDGSPMDQSNASFNIAAIPVTGVSVLPITMNFLAGGQTGTVVATIAPSNATNQNVNWTSSANGVATVSSTGVVTPLAVGTANITATTIDGGFTAVCVVTVEQIPCLIPEAPVIVSVAQPTCNLPTGSVTLNGLPTTGDWILTQKPNNINSRGTGVSTTVTGLVSGIYSYTVTNSAGCTSEISDNVIIIVPEKGVVPNITTKYNDLLICYNLGDSIVSYQWYIGPDAISDATKQYYQTRNVPGVYKVVTIDINGCMNPSNEITFTGTKSISVYPNPASNSFVLKISNFSEGDAIIRILSTTGIKVMEFDAENLNEAFQIEIPISTIKEGTYIVQVVMKNNEVYYSKVVILK